MYDENSFRLKCAICRNDISIDWLKMYAAMRRHHLYWQASGVLRLIFRSGMKHFP